MAENNNNNGNAVAEEAGAIVAVVEEKPPCKDKELGGGGEDIIPAASKNKNPFLEINNLEKILATLTLILSIPVLGFIVWIFYVRDSECESILKLPSFQIGIGVGLIFLFLISNAVVFLRSRYPVLGLLIVMVPLLLIFIIGLALVGAYKMESRSVAASPKWLRLKVFNEAHWQDIKSCIYDTGACDDLISRTLMLKSYDFSLKKLSSIESGCCTPATICEMEYVNATFWKKKEGGIVDPTNPYDSDCNLWDNDRGNLCYNCVSCKTGFLNTLQAKWWKLGVFLIIASLLLFISHLILFLSSVFKQFRT
ncbi:tetraspanin-15 [Benincasa hispida]|uniref:tetraspanin-15 n=1 Tax=Benincasa hispida TaxID=102211 RepID=UPI001902AD9A|nr:tetraspanin-15 [Benincasa hispida]